MLSHFEVEDSHTIVYARGRGGGAGPDKLRGLTSCKARNACVNCTCLNFNPGAQLIIVVYV